MQGGWLLEQIVVGIGMRSDLRRSGQSTGSDVGESGRVCGLVGRQWW